MGKNVSTTLEAFIKTLIGEEIEKQRFDVLVNYDISRPEHSKFYSSINRKLKAELKLVPVSRSTYKFSSALTWREIEEFAIRVRKLFTKSINEIDTFDVKVTSIVLIIPDGNKLKIIEILREPVKEQL